MKTTIIITITIILLISIGCGEQTIVEYQNPTDQELEAIVKGNSLTLLDAVELFALDNGGEYPESVDSDTTYIGKVLVDYLPEGERLINPFTGLRDQPIDSVPTSPGAIGYYRYNPNINVYFIQGFGANSIIIEHDNIEELEALVIADCLKLQRAVEAWRSDFSQDHYPYNNYDWNDFGNSVSDYLPGGELMKNRFTKAPYEPREWNGMPAGWGAIGYECKLINSIPVGYTITAKGFEPDVDIFQISIN